MAIDRASKVLQHLRHAVFQRDGAGLTDGQLLGCFIERRDEAAFAALVNRHGPMVWGVCRRLLGHQDAEDAFQAAFLVLSRKAASILPREMVANWLYGAARQTALMARRTAGRRKARERQVAEMPEPAAVPRDLWDDLRPLLDQELGNLPDKYRAVLVLCDLEGKTRKEAARQLGCPEGTVAGRLARARTMLAARLAKRGVALSGGSLAAILSQQAAACVPVSIVTTTIKAATAFAAGQAAAGAISAQVALLTEGVLKAMLMTKLKIATAVLLVVSIIAIPASSLAYRAFAGDGPDQKQKLAVQAERPAKEQGGTEKELRRLEAEVKRLQTDIEDLKKRPREQARKGKAGDSKLVVKVYPVRGLTNELEAEEKLAGSLMRVITNTIEPASWSAQGGDGSIEFLGDAECLVIRQSPEIHKQVQELLEALRKAKTEQKGKEGAENKV